jgi:hypothetical protein
MAEPLEAKGEYHLTKSEIGRRNFNNLEAKHWAVCFLQKISADDNPQLGFCPSVSDILCKFRNSASTGIMYERVQSLPPAVMDTAEPLSKGFAVLI